MNLVTFNADEMLPKQKWFPSNIRISLKIPVTTHYAFSLILILNTNKFVHNSAMSKSEVQ